jgi:EAL domain-containing protein (putative c-di-GMP-specific phosphodiesterase class I)
MSPITDFVILQVAQQIPLWKNNSSDFAVAVNLSPICINDLELPDRLQQLLREHDLPGSALTMEITETRAFFDSTKCMDILSRLRMMGVGLSIDDFGTGASSLQQLYRMPFNELKIDGSFVAKVTASEEARVIVRATVDLAHALKMTACAEWVESPEVFAYLESIGCDKMQGYFISEAVRAAEFETVVARWNSRPAERHAEFVGNGRTT